MKRFLLAAIGIVLVSPMAVADGLSLAGSLWQCTRDSDRFQFVITFYPGGGVGGGEFENGEVSPYIFDASRTKPGEWPGRWEQTGQHFIWAFPDQSIRIEGSLSGPGQAAARLTGTETSSGERSAITCTALSKLPKIGEGLVIPKDSRLIDLDQDDDELKVPAGTSLQQPEGGNKISGCGEPDSVADFCSAHSYIAVGIDPLRYDNAALLHGRRDAYNSLSVYGWRRALLHRDDRDIPGRDQGRPLKTIAILQRHNRQRLLRHQGWPFITVNKAVLDYPTFDDSVFDLWGYIRFVDREPTPDWWALQNRFFILEVWG